MAKNGRPTTLPRSLNQAVEIGDYTFTIEMAHAALKAEIETGLADVAAGRVGDFNTDEIVARGRRLLTDRSRSA